MNQTVEYTNFVSQISTKLAAEGLYNAEWMDGQRKRLTLMWNTGETVISAYETIRVFAAAQLSKNTVKSLNPLAGPRCRGVRYV